MRLIFCGDRKWTDRNAIEVVMKRFMVHGLSHVIEGEARGADQISGDVALKLGLEITRFPAQWKKFGRAAGPKRNTEMIQYGKPDGVVAFHRDLANSRGTRNMLNQGRKAGLKLWLFDGTNLIEF